MQYIHIYTLARKFLPKYQYWMNNYNIWFLRLSQMPKIISVVLNTSLPTSWELADSIQEELLRFRIDPLLEFPLYIVSTGKILPMQCCFHWTEEVVIRRSQVRWVRRMLQDIHVQFMKLLLRDESRVWPSIVMLQVQTAICQSSSAFCKHSCIRLVQ